MKGRIRIDADRCKGCSYCREACPAGVIAMRNKFNKGGCFTAFAQYPEKCTGCAICAVVCPEVAIEVFRDKAKNPK